ncbi:hypothetical protein M0802_003456 [Mischocyttarus mexicanus]|nr:hypothetical protein M0802_003456 [Mischocyttarus mexicanus]
MVLLLLLVWCSGGSSSSNSNSKCGGSVVVVVNLRLEKLNPGYDITAKNIQDHLTGVRGPSPEGLPFKSNEADYSHELLDLCQGNGGHPTSTAASSSSNSNLPISSHEIQTRGIPLPGMVAPSRSIHGSPMHGNPIHGGCSLEGSEKVVQQGGPTSSSSGSPYSSHGSPMRTPMSSGHGTPQDSPHVTRHRRDSEHSSSSPPIGGNITSRRGSTDVIIGPSSIQDGHHHPSGSPGPRARRRSDYSPHQVTKLREHWDETNSKVMQRKTQLDAMLGDSQRYETKRNEVEVWLARMETRLERMRAVGHTADVLEAQLREQKSFHAELHQYKNQIELFNQLTQKLIAVYQQDDTTRVKKMTETINQRYNNLNTSIINRGKLLHSAMNSLHNFDRSLDKFLAWLSESESSMEGLEAEADRLGGRRDQGALRRPQHQLKALSSKFPTISPPKTNPPTPYPSDAYLPERERRNKSLRFSGIQELMIALEDVKRDGNACL